MKQTPAPAANTQDVYTITIRIRHDMSDTDIRIDSEFLEIMRAFKGHTLELSGKHLKIDITASGDSVETKETTEATL